MRRRCTDEVIEAAWEREWWNAQDARRAGSLTRRQAQDVIDALRENDARNASLTTRGDA